MATLADFGVLDAYEDLAPLYDAFTAHHDYEGWTDTLEVLSRRHGLRGDRVLDLACGTGKSLVPWTARGYRVVGCDLSPAMLARAAAKAPAVELHVADLRALPLLGSFDLVLCLDDSLNYLHDESALADAFAGASRLLAPEGLLIFDVNCLRTYRTSFARDACCERDGVFFAWRGETDGATDGVLAQATVEAFVPSGDTWRRITSVHRQRHHTVGVVTRELRAAGLDCRAVHGVHPDGALDPLVDERRHTKALFVARLGPTRYQARR
jgi:SAM-dependent methyltransferase